MAGTHGIPPRSVRRIAVHCQGLPDFAVNYRKMRCIMQPLLTMDEVMKITGFSRTTVNRGIRMGWFPAPIRLGPRAIRWERETIERFLRENAGRGRG
jgi:prophage regulatory protein